jgi:hypothetical protein
MRPAAFVIVCRQSLLHEALLILTLKIAQSILRRRETSFYAGAWSSSSFRSGAIHVVLDVVSNCVWLSLLSQVVYSLGLVQTKIGC